MGARASRRRHEGRRIRKFRRKYGSVTAGFARVTASMLPLGRAAKRATSAMGMLVEVWDTPSGSIATAQQPDGTVLVGIDPGSGAPSQTGVEVVRSPQEAAEMVDAKAVEMGLQLLPWQRELAIATLEGRPLAVVGGKQSGRATVKRVIDGVRADVTWGDEAHRLAP